MGLRAQGQTEGLGVSGGVSARWVGLGARRLQYPLIKE